MLSSLYTTLTIIIVLTLSVTTIFELCRKKNKLNKDHMTDELRAMAWKVVFFLILPVLTWFDFKSTIVFTEHFGGWIVDPSYSLLWYNAIPQNLPNTHKLILAVFSGEIIQFLFALTLLPSLFFRPHPFVSSIVSYTICLISASNLIVEPLLSLVGAGNSRWQIIFNCPEKNLICLTLLGHFVLAVLFLILVRNKTVRLWFAGFTYPLLINQLKVALAEAKSDKTNQFQSCRLIILLTQVGMNHSAQKELKHIKKIDPNSLYIPFLEAWLAYRNRNYKDSRIFFERASNYSDLSELLKASFLSAAACAAYAEGDPEGALNLCQRALEFDNCALIARMVKVDAYLRLGKKEEAATAVLEALKQGLNFDSEDKLPIDPNVTIKFIFRYQKELLEKSYLSEQDKIEKKENKQLSTISSEK